MVKTTTLRRGIAVLSLAGAVFATAGSGEEQKATKVDGSATSSSQAGTKDSKASGGETFKVGDAVKLGDWQLTVNKVTDPYQSDNEFDKPKAGNRFVVVNATVVNNSSKSQTVSSMLCFDVRDSEGQKFDPAIVTAASPDLGGDLAAGQKMKGNVAFEIPTESKDLTLNFKCDLFSSGSAQVQLSK